MGSCISQSRRISHHPRKIDRIPNEVILSLIPNLFTLKQYGFTSSDFPNATSKIPASLQIRCWEANDVEKYFPSDQVEIMLTRRKERESTREMIQSMLEGMDDIEKVELIKGEKLDKSVDKPKEAERFREMTPKSSVGRFDRKKLTKDRDP